MDSLTGYGRANPEPGPELLDDQHTVGKLMVVHEGSFHLQTEQGLDLPFMIPDDAKLDIAEMRRLMDAGTLVEVSFRGSPGAHGAQAYGVQQTSPPAAGPERGSNR